MGQLEGVEVFVKVIQCGSFSAAARVLQMPVTTVSGKVASLEKRLGVTLIHRTTRKLNITEAGDAYFKHCVRAIDEVSAAEKALLTSKVEPEGLLRITAPADIGHLVLPSLARSYLKAYPKTQIDMILTNRVVDLVGEGVDLAIRAGKLKDSTLVTKKFLDAELVLYASSAYIKKFGMPRQPKDVSEHSFIGFRSFAGEIKLTNGRQSHLVPVKPRITVDDLEAIKVFVMNGDGIGMLSTLTCGPELAGGKILRVLPGWDLEFDFGTRGHLSFVYPPQRYVSPKIQAFIEMAMKHTGF
jgi:DNA-binding transcriptional LysR family regulator